MQENSHDLSNRSFIQYGEVDFSGNSDVNPMEAEVIQASSAEYFMNVGSVKNFFEKAYGALKLYQGAMSDKLIDNIGIGNAELSDKSKNLPCDIQEGEIQKLHLSINGKYENHNVTFNMDYVNKDHCVIDITQGAKSYHYDFTLSNDNRIIQSNDFEHMVDMIKVIDVSKMTIEGLDIDASGYGKDYDFNLSMHANENNVYVDSGCHGHDNTIMITPITPIDAVAIEHALVA